MDRQQVARWLEDYIEAWKSNDPASIGDLFSEGALYRYHAYDEPERGRDAIVESWLAEPDDPGSFEARYEPVAVDGDIAVALGRTTYLDDDGSVESIFDNCFVLHFDDRGRCREFTEWYAKHPD